jgi:ribosomal-protein-alanine N-acetyltransferase
MAADFHEAPRVTLRDMTADDIRAVRRIESLAYEDAWPARTFEEELANAFAHYRVAVEHYPPASGTIAALRRKLAGPHERILGFIGCWYMVDQIHLVTLAVDPAEQGRGVGRRLLLDLFDLARTSELNQAVLEVRVSNTRARRLYEEFGFRLKGTLHQYYKDNNEDAHVMITGDLSDPEAIERLARLRREHHRRFGPRFVDAPVGQTEVGA